MDKKRTAKWSRAQLKTIKGLAANMYINYGDSLVKISQELEVSEQTLNKWAKGDAEEPSWDDQRLVIETTPSTIKTRIQLEMSNIVKGEKPTLNADALNKLNSVYKTFTDTKNEVVIQHVFINFNLWLSKTMPEKALGIAQIQRLYLHYIIKNKNG